MNEGSNIPLQYVITMARKLDVEYEIWTRMKKEAGWACFASLIDPNHSALETSTPKGCNQITRGADHL